MSAPTSPLKTVVGAGVIVAVISVAGYFGFQRVFATPAPPKPPAIAPPLRPAVVAPSAPVLIEAVVTSAVGRVEKGTLEGPWSPVAAGDLLLANDRLRTDGLGRAELTIGDKARLTVTASTEIKVRELTQTVHQIQLKQGRVVAAYDAEGTRVLRIEDEKGLAVAEAKDAKFSVLVNGRALAVATETGTVNLTAAGRRVEVGSGQQAVAQDGQAPSAASAIPAQLLLKIARAQKSVPKVCVDLEGAVDPGAELRIDGERVVADPAGRFSVKVPRLPGHASARVTVRDASGRPREQEVKCIPETEPDLKLQLQWDTTGSDAG